MMSVFFKLQNSAWMPIICTVKVALEIYFELDVLTDFNPSIQINSAMLLVQRVWSIEVVDPGLWVGGFES